MQRIPEPQLMDDFEQARAYALADFEEPHTLFIEELTRRFPGERFDHVVLDLGCGTADITRRFAEAFPQCRLHAIDGAEQMLMFARQTVDFLRLHERIRLFKRLLPAESLPKELYHTVISNSLLHHLDEPMVLWQTINRFAAPGGAIFVMDLMRPASREDAERIVRQYAASEPPVLQQDFFNSLLAAYTPEEVRAQLVAAGLGHLEVGVVSDRHLTVSGKK